MPNENETRTSLKGRVAAEKAEIIRTAKIKSAAAWTLAKTLLPTAPHKEQVRFAQSLMASSPVALKVALQTTAINAHWSRVAEQFEKVHKVDLNDLLEDPSVLSSEKKSVEQEMKSDAKNASAKKADDRSDAGPLPTEYPEPKRDEPTELDAQNADKGRPEFWTDGPGKEASKKTAACDDACKTDCEHRKAARKAAAQKAAAQKAAAKKIADEADALAAPVDQPVDQVDTTAEEATDDADQALAEADDAEIEAEDGDAANDEVPAEGDDDAGSDEETEEFDPEKQNLQEAAADVQADVDRLQDAVAEFIDQPSDLDIPEGDGEQTDENFDFFGGETDGEQVDAEIEAEEGDTDGDGGDGEELNLSDIFNEDNMSDKVSSLNDEGTEIEVDFADGDDFFAPSDPSELESVLEQEEDLSSAADMFSVGEVEADPLARILASSKRATEDVVEPGEIDGFFETELKGEDRDFDSDHENTIFDDVIQSIKQPTRDDDRDTEPNLKSASARVSAKAQPGIRKLKPGAGTKSASTAKVANLASLLFTDENDFV